MSQPLLTQRVPNIDVAAIRLASCDLERHGIAYDYLNSNIHSFTVQNLYDHGCVEGTPIFIFGFEAGVPFTEALAASASDELLKADRAATAAAAEAAPFVSYEVSPLTTAGKEGRYTDAEIVVLAKSDYIPELLGQAAQDGYRVASATQKNDIAEFAELLGTQDYADKFVRSRTIQELQKTLFFCKNLSPYR